VLTHGWGKGCPSMSISCPVVSYRLETVVILIPSLMFVLGCVAE